MINVHLYSIGIWTTIIQDVVDGDLSCIVHCSVTALSTIDGQWDIEDTFIKIVIHLNVLTSIQFTSNSHCFTSGLPHVCVLHIHTQGYSVVCNILNCYSLKLGRITATDTLLSLK